MIQSVGIMTRYRNSLCTVHLLFHHLVSFLFFPEPFQWPAVPSTLPQLCLPLHWREIPPFFFFNFFTICYCFVKRLRSTMTQPSYHGKHSVTNLIFVEAPTTYCTWSHNTQELGVLPRFPNLNHLYFDISGLGGQICSLLLRIRQNFDILKTLASLSFNISGSQRVGYKTNTIAMQISSSYYIRL